MANVLIKGMILNRADTEANWTAENPILAAGEIGVCTDKQYMKVGNGTSSWSDLKKFQANIVEDSLGSSSSVNALSARMGKELSDRIGDVVILDTDENANLVEALNSLNQKITNLPVATPDTDGLMSSEDKVKVDGLEEGLSSRPQATDTVAAAGLSGQHGLRVVDGKLEVLLSDGVTWASTGETVEIVDALTSTDPTKALSAAQGKVLYTMLAGKTLWTGTQAAYNAISPKNANTIYMIYE